MKQGDAGMGSFPTDGVGTRCARRLVLRCGGPRLTRLYLFSVMEPFS
jgi:hypothetical protein